ncbi:hypothetical protein [Thermophilibacter sp.]
MAAPVVIGIVAGPRDGEVTSALLRTILDGDEPYGRAGVLGARETYDGVEWTPRPAPGAGGPLARWDDHLAHARERGLPYLIAELGEKDPRPQVDLLCTLGAGGAGTVRAGGRGLSFSARSPMADVGAGAIRSGYGLVRFRATTPSWDDVVALPLTGAFNVGPALAAIGVCELLGVDREQVANGLLHARASAHGGLCSSPDGRVFALIEDSADPRDGERLAEAARADYESFVHETVRGAGAVDAAVAHAYKRDGATMLVLLGDPADRLEDAFQLATRRRAKIVA